MANNPVLSIRIARSMSGDRRNSTAAVICRVCRNPHPQVLATLGEDGQRTSLEREEGSADD